MSTTRQGIPFTYEDYKTLPASAEVRHELIDGELHMVPGPTIAHQVVSQNLVLALRTHIDTAPGGLVLYAPFDVVLGEGKARNVVQPDIVVITNARRSIVTEDEIVGAPDLVIEILSPGTADRDAVIKKSLYERGGVPEYWIVDPKLEAIERFSLETTGYGPPSHHEAGGAISSITLPGFEMPVRQVFESL